MKVVKSSYTELGKEILAINKANGWNVTTPVDWAKSNKLNTICALIQSEASEALEGFRKGDLDNVAEELADVKIRVLDCLSGLEVDYDSPSLQPVSLWKEITKVNMELPYIFPSWLNILSCQLWRASASIEYAENFHVHRNCFVFYMLNYMAGIEKLAKMCGMDLDKAIRKKLEKNKTRGFKHGGKKV